MYGLKQIKYLFLLAVCGQKTRSLCNPAVISQHFPCYVSHLCASISFTVINTKEIWTADESPQKNLLSFCVALQGF